MSTSPNAPASNDQARIMPYIVEFVKFAVSFTIIIALALITLHFASAAMAAP